MKPYFKAVREHKSLVDTNRLRGDLPPNRRSCFRCNDTRAYRGYVWGVEYHWFACLLCEDAGTDKALPVGSDRRVGR
jgi:hypothetical protein